MTITYQPKNEPEWIIGGSKPPAEELWNILSAERAREIASRMSPYHRETYGMAVDLRAYADKVDELQGKG